MLYESPLSHGWGAREVSKPALCDLFDWYGLPGPLWGEDWGNGEWAKMGAILLDFTAEKGYWAGLSCQRPPTPCFYGLSLWKRQLPSQEQISDHSVPEWREE